MSSIIKVDAIQKADGTTPTASDLGLNVTGATLQLQKAITAGNAATTAVSCSPTSTAIYGGVTANRTYGLAETVTITPKSSSSILYCVATVGWTSMAVTGTMAHGAIITRDDGTDSIDNNDYPWYSHHYWSGSTPYWPLDTVTGFFNANNTNQQTIRLRPYGYIESGSGSFRWRGSQLFVFEIAG
jgi:hypothetical protein